MASYLIKADKFFLPGGVALGGYLKVRPVVAMENVMVGLKKSLPERAWKMLPANEEAIRHGGEIIRKR